MQFNHLGCRFHDPVCGYSGYLLLPVGKGSTMEKWMCIGSIGVAVIMLLLFTVDLFMGWPFSNGNAGYDSPFGVVDGAGFVGAGILAYLGLECVPRFEMICNSDVSATQDWGRGGVSATQRMPLHLGYWVRSRDSSQ